METRVLRIRFQHASTAHIIPDAVGFIVSNSYIPNKRSEVIRLFITECNIIVSHYISMYLNSTLDGSKARAAYGSEHNMELASPWIKVSTCEPCT